MEQVETGSSYAAPIGLVLEAIHIAMTRPPPDHALHRGDIDPRRGQHSMSMVDRVIRRMSHTSSSQENGEDAAEDETPRPKRSRPHR
jgi:hypothetical protein